MSLNAYASANVKKRGPACTVCLLFKEYPSVAKEVRKDRSILRPHTWRVTAGYLTGILCTATSNPNASITMNMVRDHFYAHEGDR